MALHRGEEYDGEWTSGAIHSLRSFRRRVVFSLCSPTYRTLNMIYILVLLLLVSSLYVLLLVIECAASKQRAPTATPAEVSGAVARVIVAGDPVCHHRIHLQSKPTATSSDEQAPTKRDRSPEVYCSVRGTVDDGRCCTVTVTVCLLAVDATRTRLRR